MGGIEEFQLTVHKPRDVPVLINGKRHRLNISYSFHLWQMTGYQ